MPHFLKKIYEIFMSRKHYYYSNKEPSVEHHYKMADDRIRELEIMITLINIEIILARILACTVVYTVSYGLTRSLTVLYDRLYDYTRTSHPCQFF